MVNNQIGILDYCDYIVKVVLEAIAMCDLRLYPIILEIMREFERYYGSTSTRIWGIFRVGGDPEVKSRLLF